MTDMGIVDVLFPDDVFGMGGGYVLNFSDGAFAESFAQALNLDTIIAAVAEAHGCTVVTGNEKDFADIAVINSVRRAVR
jgi:hypothetical protein